MIGLPKKNPADTPANCRDCNDKLTKKNWIKYTGKKNARCRKCLSKYVQKYNQKRYKRIKENKLW